MLRFRPLNRTDQNDVESIYMSDARARDDSPSSNLRPIAGQSFPIFSLYASITEENNGSDSGCVEANARSNTYRSTALSSASVEV
jgi:hypothetical protein